MREIFLAESCGAYLKEVIEKKPTVKGSGIGPASSSTTVVTWVGAAKNATHYKTYEAANQAIVRVREKGGIYSVEKKWIAE